MAENLTYTFNLSSRQKNIEELVKAVRRGNIRVVETALNLGVDINGGIGDEAYSATYPLHEAIRGGHTGIARLLIDRGADINKKDGWNDTPLIRAAWSDKTAIARLLMEKGARLDEKDLDSLTALHRAASNGNVEIVRLLIDHGADVGGGGKTVLDCAEGHPAVIQMLLETHYYQKLRAEEQTAPEIDRLDAIGNNKLHDAVRRGDVEAVKDLIARGANLDKTDRNGNTALNLAARDNHGNIVRLLVDNGANINISNQHNMSPRGCAGAGGHTDIVRFLEKAAPEQQRRLTQEKTELAKMIADGNCQKVRDIFDRAFWENRPLFLRWEHLKPALLRQDRPMMRLLITWGATVPAEAVAELTTLDYTLLRQCGLRMSSASETPAAEPAKALAAESALAPAENKTLDGYAALLTAEKEKTLEYEEKYDKKYKKIMEYKEKVKKRESKKENIYVSWHI